MDNKDVLRLYKATFDTTAGRELLDLLKQMYVARSVVSSTPELTYYHLGKKEVVEEIIIALETKEEDLNQTGDYLND